MDQNTYAHLESYIHKEMKKITNHQEDDHQKNQNQQKGRGRGSKKRKETHNNSMETESKSVQHSLSNSDSPISKTTKFKESSPPNKNNNSSYSLSFHPRAKTYNLKTSPYITYTSTPLDPQNINKNDKTSYLNKKMAGLILLFVIFLVAYFTYNYSLFLQDPQVTVKTIPAFWKMHSQTIISKMQTLFSWSAEQSKYIFDTLKRQQIFQNMSNFLLKYKDLKPSTLINYLKNNAIKETMVKWIKGVGTFTSQTKTTSFHLFFQTVMTPISQIIWQSVFKYSNQNQQNLLKLPLAS